ncbi:MAG: GH92 family glycosyl hydrolase [Prolixibacteraceae bacterium]|nr:GH92 family glycosyl hydrolase [Prolixibacteraceae bacterium]
MEGKTYFLLLILLFAVSSCQEKQAVDYVDPFICTQGDHGHWLPAAVAPFGLVELCADTYPGSLTADGNLAHSGYDYSDSQLRGFSHFHHPSSGGVSICDRSGLLSVMPFVTAPTDTFFKNPVADFDKHSERARAGYYSTRLSRENILAEFAAMPHVGYHKYTFPEGSPVNLFLYEGNRSGSAAISFKMAGEQTIEGMQSVFGGIYFVMEFNVPVVYTNIWNGSELGSGNALDNQADGGMVCGFGDLKAHPLEVRVGVSLTGIEAARANLRAECPEWGFEKVEKKAAELWNEKLSRIKVEGNEEYKTIFYTALYHSCFLPVVLSDTDGAYPGIDGQVHHAEGYKHYNNYAFWDSFRTKYPLYSLFMPDVYRDIVKSLRDLYSQADNYAPFPDHDHPAHGIGFSPRGKNGFQPFSTCRHEHMLMVMTDAYFKGLFDIDVASVYPYLRQEALLQMPERYDSIGYIPARPDQTGEYSWDNWCVAQVAKSIGNDEDYRYFLKRSEYWKNTWAPSIRFFRARAADGTWLDFPDDPTINREKYTYEGSKWHWRWNVLHDVPGLIEKFGGKDAFLKELEYFFDNDLYTAGNQIDLQAPFLFNTAGAPWLTQKWVQKILTEPIVQKYGTHDFFPEPIFDRVYKATPDGYLKEMDCDYGCMAAWYTMSAMGLYQLCPGDPVYQITAPVFDKVTIHLDNSIYKGKKFTMKARNLSKENIYIQSASLNGQPLSRSWLSHKEIADGGELVFEMGIEPNKTWGME